MAENGDKTNNTFEQVKGHVFEAADQTSRAVEEGIQAASYAVKAGTIKAKEEYSKAVESSQSILDTGFAHYKQLEDKIFERLKSGVQIAADHQTATLTGLAGLTLLVLPGARRFFARQTFGRLRSEEAVFITAQARAESLSEALKADAAEAEKLLQRLSAAEAQYDQGLSKLSATSRQLQSLSARVKGTQSSAEQLVKILRDVPTKEALALRSEAALKVAAAKQQRAMLEKRIYGVMKRGI